MKIVAEPKVVVSAQIEREQREALEELAREQDRTISYLVRRAVDRYLGAETRGRTSVERFEVPIRMTA